MASRRYLAARRVFERADVQVGGVRIATRRAGPEPGAPGGPPPVVLLPGLGLSARYLLPFGAELAEHVPVWAPDPPGFGRSARPRELLDLPALGRFVIAWMDAVGLERAVLYGNSMGCQIAVEATVAGPDRVAAVVLDAPTIDAGARSVARHTGRILLDALLEAPSIALMQTRDWLVAGPRRMVATTRYTFAHHIEDRLPGVHHPVLVVRGGRDPIVPQGWTEHVTALLPRGVLEVVPGGSHAMVYSDPSRLAERTLAFVTSRR